MNFSDLINTIILFFDIDKLTKLLDIDYDFLYSYNQDEDTLTLNNKAFIKQINIIVFVIAPMLILAWFSSRFMVRFDLTIRPLGNSSYSNITNKKIILFKFVSFLFLCASNSFIIYCILSYLISQIIDFSIGQNNFQALLETVINERKKQIQVIQEINEKSIEKKEKEKENLHSQIIELSHELINCQNNMDITTNLKFLFLGMLLMFMLTVLVIIAIFKKNFQHIQSSFLFNNDHNNINSTKNNNKDIVVQKNSLSNNSFLYK